MLSYMLFAWLLNGGCTGVINTTHVGNKWRWAAYSKEQPVVPWDRSHWCVSGMQSLYSSFLVFEYLHFKPVWAELYSLFLAACERACCQAFSFRLVSTIFWKFVAFSLYSVPSMSWLQRTTLHLRQLHFSCHVPGGASNVYRWDKSFTVQCMNTLKLALSHHSEGNQ